MITGMRMVLVSMALALLALVPSFSYRMDRDLPGTGFLKIPATGLDYMAVFFHEIGHTAARWAFGYPAFPAFDFGNGGGMTYGLARGMGLQYAVWAGMALGLAWLFKNGGRGLFYIACLVAGFLFLLSFSPKHEALCVYMGHGAEIMIACFCILRALIGATARSHGAAERYLNMVFGLYVLGRNLFLSADIMFSDVGRMVYDMQKGGHVQGDFRTLAQMLGMGIEGAAGLSLAFMGVMVAVTLFLAWWLRGEVSA